MSEYAVDLPLALLASAYGAELDPPTATLPSTIPLISLEDQSDVALHLEPVASGVLLQYAAYANGQEYSGEWILGGIRAAQSIELAHYLAYLLPLLPWSEHPERWSLRYCQSNRLELIAEAGDLINALQQAGQQTLGLALAGTPEQLRAGQPLILNLVDRDDGLPLINQLTIIPLGEERWQWDLSEPNLAVLADSVIADPDPWWEGDEPESEESTDVATDEEEGFTRAELKVIEAIGEARMIAGDDDERQMALALAVAHALCGDLDRERGSIAIELAPDCREDRDDQDPDRRSERLLEHIQDLQQIAHQVRRVLVSRLMPELQAIVVMLSPTHTEEGRQVFLVELQFRGPLCRFEMPLHDEVHNEVLDALAALQEQAPGLLPEDEQEAFQAISVLSNWIVDLHEQEALTLLRRGWIGIGVAQGAEPSPPRGDQRENDSPLH